MGRHTAYTAHPSEAFGLVELGVTDHNVEVLLQHVVHGEPVLPRGLHANILAVVLDKPCRKVAQSAGIGRKPLAVVAGNALAVRGRYACDHKVAVYIHTAADRVNNLESSHYIPPKWIRRRKQGLDAPAKTSNVFAQISLQATASANRGRMSNSLMHERAPGYLYECGLTSPFATYLRVLCSVQTPPVTSVA